MSYTDVFGGANIYPSDVSYSLLTLTADVTLSWPEETSASTNLATSIIDVAATAGAIRLPAANKVATGETILFNNVGAVAFQVQDSVAAQIITVQPGTLWQVYLSDNSTVAGVWKSLQYGASVSQANAAVLAGTGIVAVGTLLSQSIPVTTFNSDYIVGVPDRARMFLWNGVVGTLTLPAASVLGGNWFCYLRNSGTGALLVQPSGMDTIDGVRSLSFQLGESAIITTDGSNFYTIGFGQSATFAFDYTTVDVAGSGNYTLSTTELNRIVYKFTGVLTGNRDVIIPATVQQYWIDNSTTGTFIFKVRTAAGVGIALNSGQRGIFYCNGTDLVDADTSTASFPISVFNGGTGANTAGGALINLGGTAVGIGIFNAVDAAAAWAVLGNMPLLIGGTF